jgi:hypothetical protein
MNRDSGVRGLTDRKSGSRPTHHGRTISALAIRTAPGATSRLSLYTPKPYVYRGTGADTLTPWMDDEPDGGPRLTRRRERMELLTELRLHTGPEVLPPPGCITAQQAADLLGVTVRTIERYKRELAGRAA